MTRERGKIPTDTNKESVAGKHGTTKQQILSKPPIDYKSIKKIEPVIPTKGSNTKPPIDKAFISQEADKIKVKQEKLMEPKPKEFTKRVEIEHGKDR